jgi:hypothetical protein
MERELIVTDGRVDFDFLIGNWEGHQRRLRERLKDSTEWEEFESDLTVQRILGGLGNFDEIVFHREGGDMIGVTLRLFDIEHQQWRIYWAADRSGGVLDVPMVGSFKDGRGLFYAQELFEGKAIFSRFIWTVFSEDKCRWEQAFSPDGGQTWETNWMADFTRVD